MPRATLLKFRNCFLIVESLQNFIKSNSPSLQMDVDLLSRIVFMYSVTSLVSVPSLMGGSSCQSQNSSSSKDELDSFFFFNVAKLVS